VVPEEDTVGEYYDIRSQLDTYGSDVAEVITHPNYSLPFLQPGRLVRIKQGDMDFGWGVVINFAKRAANKVRLFKAQRYLELKLRCE